MIRAKKPNKKTSSPVFGTSSSKIEDISNEGDRSKGENFLENPFQDISNDEKQEENEKINSLKQEINVKEEEHKQQILHIETLGMMTKYQLVFIKLETCIYKVNQTILTRELLNKSDAFYSILNFIKFNETSLIYKKKLVANRLKKTLMNNFFQPVSHHILKATSYSFYKIYEFSKIFYKQKKWDEELQLINGENSVSLIKKEQDLKILMKKSEELAVQINSLKTKENEYMTKIKLQDQMIASLQQESSSNEQILKKTAHINEGSTKVKVLEQKFKELEIENQELKEKLSLTENNLGTFIKEMSELLDNHELSTNLGTDENFSLNNSNNNENLDEEIENFLRSKGRNIGVEDKGNNSAAKSFSTKENRLFAAQNTKNASKSYRGNVNNIQRNKK